MSELHTEQNGVASSAPGESSTTASTSSGAALHEQPGWIAVLVGVMMFLTALLSGSILYRLSQTALESEVRANLMRTARTAGTIVDANLHRTFVTRDQEKSPQYLQAIEPLEAMRQAAGDIRFIYTCVLVSNQVYFVLDPTPEGDADRDGVDDKSHIMQPYEEASEELIAALKSGQAGANSEPYTDAWGTFVSGFAPFHDSNGHLVGVVAVDLNAKSYADRLAGMRTSAWVGVGVAFLLSLAAGRAIHRLQRRLEDYRRRVQSLNARLEHRVIERTAQLEASRRKLEDEVVERRKAEAEANSAKEAAETANRAKSQFLANMSHELRTPMNGIIGYTNFLADTPLNDEQREFANTIRICGESLLNIINDVLDFSRIEAGKMSVENATFNLRQIAAQAVELLSPTAEEKGLELAFCSSPGLNAQVTGDPNRARQVLLNLLGNAIKFTEHGHVAVSLEEEPDRPGWMRCAVQDTGIGIPAEKHSLLFEHFSQVDASNTRKFGGTGLGLAISKRLAELMGGNMGFVSEADRGSTFWFALPPAEVPEQPAVRKLLPGLETARVLVVDSSEVTCRSLGQHLAYAGIEHAFAHSPAEAIQRLAAAAMEERSFQIVLVDILKPDMNGTELVRRMESMPSLRHTALVMLASGSRRAEAAHFAAAGCASSLFKPLVHPARLIEALGVAWREHLVAAGKTELLRLAPAPQSSVPAPAILPVMPTWRVLLVEDNVVNRGLAKTLLERFGCEVDIAINGREGVLKSAINAYDVIFMDCQMPHMDGFEAVNAIRRREGNLRHTPIVAVTANALNGDRERCLASGMDDYIAKPIVPEELRRACFRWAKSTHDLLGNAPSQESQGLNSGKGI